RFHVAEHKVLEIGIALERNTGLLAHGAVSTVTADDVPRADALFDPVGASEHSVDAVVIDAHVRELDAMLDRDTTRCEVRRENRFGLGLRDEQDEREARVGGREATKIYLLAALAGKMQYQTRARVTALD